MYNDYKENKMQLLTNILQKMLFFEKEPQKIGLSQFKDEPEEKAQQPSLQSKNVKLSDLMRRS